MIGLKTVASTQKINKWLALSLDDAEYEIRRFITTASKDAIELVFEQQSQIRL